jgi:hypothetical protein
MNPTTDLEEETHIRHNRLGELCGATGSPTPEQWEIIEKEVREWRRSNLRSKFDVIRKSVDKPQPQ